MPPLFRGAATRSLELMKGVRRDRGGNRTVGEAATAPPARLKLSATAPILCVDLGGSFVKGYLVSPEGTRLQTLATLPTPAGITPDGFLGIVSNLVKQVPSAGNVVVALPTRVKDGMVPESMNVGSADWVGYPIEAQLEQLLGRPVRALKDADLHMLGAAETNRGVQLLLSLGTGLGTSMMVHDEVLPNVELASLVMPKSAPSAETEHPLDGAVRMRVGDPEWNRSIARALETFDAALRPDYIHLSGGSARHVDLEGLSADVRPKVSIVGNGVAARGAARLVARESGQDTFTMGRPR